MNDDGDRERVLRVERFYEIRASMSEVELYTLELEENSREYRNKDSREKRNNTRPERERHGTNAFDDVEDVEDVVAKSLNVR